MAGGLILPLILAFAAAARACPAASAIGLSRVVEIDTATGPLYGDLTQHARQPEVLAPMEVVLTFDDGPMPWITRSILDTLDVHCTRATFFSVGRMAITHPHMVREVIARGHTMGTHTFSHPLDLRRRPLAQSVDEIERGIAAVAAAAGVPIAPFFRFPGLADSQGMLAHLQSRGIAAFTVDVVSNDSYISDADRLLRETLAKIEARKGGIVLFHDIKASAAKALPPLLAQLKQRGYRVVHLVAKGPAVPERGLMAEYVAQVAKVDARRRSGEVMVTFFGAVIPNAGAVQDGVPVTPVQPVVNTFAPMARQPEAHDQARRSWRVEVKRNGRSGQPRRAEPE
jgi:peptidoglycan/xylan/chitin deacetylase (PgdA/CDA1 family)